MNEFNKPNTRGTKRKHTKKKVIDKYNTSSLRYPPSLPSKIPRFLFLVELSVVYQESIPSQSTPLLPFASPSSYMYLSSLTINANLERAKRKKQNANNNPVETTYLTHLGNQTLGLAARRKLKTHSGSLTQIILICR